MLHPKRYESWSTVRAYSCCLAMARGLLCCRWTREAQSVDWYDETGTGTGTASTARPELRYVHRCRWELASASACAICHVVWRVQAVAHALRHESTARWTCRACARSVACTYVRTHTHMGTWNVLRRSGCAGRAQRTFLRFATKLEKPSRRNGPLEARTLSSPERDETLGPLPS